MSAPLDDDRVGVRLGADQYRYSQDYSYTHGIFEAPPSLSMRLGGNDSTAALLKRYPAGTPAQIAVAGREQFTGTTDGFAARGNASISQIGLKAKGILKNLVKSQITKSQELNGPTYRALAERALSDLNMTHPFTGDPIQIVTSNTDNRRVITGQGGIVVGDVASDAALAKIAGVQGARWPVLRFRLGESYYDLLNRKFDAAGLLMWESASGDIVIGTPNVKQPACAAVIRKRDRIHNVQAWAYEIDETPRYSTVQVFGRTTGRKYARTTINGAASDIDLLLRGVRWVKIVRDRPVTSVEQAAHVARKHIAEGRRAGFVLEYTLSRHTTESILSRGDRITWAPDIMVHVEDDELGLSGDYWLERVTGYRNDEGTFTTIRLFEPSMMVFVSEEDDTVAAPGTSSGASPALPGQKQYFVINDTSLTDLSLILYADTTHAAELQNLNQALVTFDTVRKQNIIPADTTIVYIPAK